MNESEKQELGEVDELKFDVLTYTQAYEEVGDIYKTITLKVVTHVGEVKDWPEDLNQTVIARTTFKGTRVFASEIEYNKETNNVEFFVFTKLPHYFPEEMKDLNVATTYMDFCWILSGGTKAENKDEVETKYDEDCILGDLNWLIPSKFSDDFVEMMHVMNEVVLNGELSQSIIYGPFYKQNNK